MPQQARPHLHQPAPNGVVVVLTAAGGGLSSLHERMTRTEIAKRLAGLMNFEFGGEYDAGTRYPGRLYFVPSRTLVGLETAQSLGIRGEQDLFGGVVPHAFVATKAITQPLVTPDACAPPGWNRAFGDAVQNLVLAGFSVFTREDARRAAETLLRCGRVRLKPVLATGGRGQVLLSDLAELETALEAVDPDELSSCGLVLEEDLTGTTTYSVGQVRSCNLLVTYYGTQRVTTDNSGREVYGGSTLVVVRDGFEALLALDIPKLARIAIRQAQAYDSAAWAHFPGLLVSRRNYDVIQGLDARGRWRSGVLEQSWRLGGASAAEIAALEAFAGDPGLRVVRASCVEIYGDSKDPPTDSITLFRGVDNEVGFISKYAMVDLHDTG